MLGNAGEYELVEEIGHGGMGAVFKARHRTLNRWVALKRIRLERWDNPESVLRFQLESEAVARLDHPGIIPIHETGESDGLHYFTMKLVEGGNLADRLAASSGADGTEADRSATRWRTRGPWLRGMVECLVKISAAVHYAHQRGVIHRDLKPANILFDAQGEPLVSDFGLAKILEREGGVTQTRAVLGSPSYMAPEQASGDTSRISTGSDIYSLGAILYEILTGEPPFKAATALETMRRLVEEHPRRPRAFEPRVDADLERVCLKCLEKDPKDRYASAAELADDLRRWLNGQPVNCRPVSAAHHLWRWCGRNPGMAGAIGAVAALLMTVAVGASVAAIRIRAAQQETAKVVMQMQIEKAEHLLEVHPAQGLALMAHVVRRHPENQDAAVRLAWELGSRNFAVPVFEPLAHESRLVVATPSSTGDWMVTLTEQGRLRMWETATGRLSGETNAAAGVISGAAAADGSRLILGTKEGLVQVWNVGPGLNLAASFQPAPPAPVKPVFMDPEGNLIGTVTHFDRTAEFWDATTGARLFRLEAGAAITAAAISADARWIGLGLSDGSVTVWDLRTLEPMPWSMRHSSYVSALAFSLNNRYLASSSHDQTAHVWDLTAEGRSMLRIDHKHEVTHVKFSNDSRRVATAALDKVAQVWDLVTLKPLVDPVSHSEGLTSAHLVPGNGFLATTTYGNLAWLWRFRPAVAQPLQLSVSNSIHAVDISHDGNWIVTGDCQGTIQLWEAASGRAFVPPMKHDNQVSATTFGPDAQRLVTAGFDSTARVWDLTSGNVRILEHDNWVRTARFNPSGDRIVTASHDNTARIWNPDTGESIELRHDNDVESATFSHNGQFVGTASKDGTARLWDASTGRLLARFNHRSWVTAIQFRHDDQFVVTASLDKTAAVWSLNASMEFEPTPLAVLRHDGELAHASFSPDGMWIVTASYDRSARIWNSSTGQPQPFVLAHENPVVFATFSPDSRRVVTASRDGSARVWSVTSGQALTGALRHEGIALHAMFSPDGESVVTTSLDGIARVWPLPAITSYDGLWLADVAQYLSRISADANDQFVALGAPELIRIRQALLSRRPAPDLVTALLGIEDRPVRNQPRVPRENHQ